jgi:hypothetical protein
MRTAFATRSNGERSRGISASAETRVAALPRPVSIADVICPASPSATTSGAADERIEAPQTGGQAKQSDKRKELFKSI